MSETTKGKPQRDAQTHVSSTHLKQTEENWGDVPAPKSNPVSTKAPANDDLKKELEDEEEEDNEEEENNEEEEETSSSKETISSTKETPSTDSLEALQQLQQNVPQIQKMLEAQREELRQKRAKLNEELDNQELEIKKRLNLLYALSGTTPPPEEESDQPRRRRRRVTTTENPEGGESRTGGRRGPRLPNDYTIKEAIMIALYQMQHPKSGQKHTAFVPDLATEVTTKVGYNTVSKQPTNTVRAALYKMEADKTVKVNDDGTYTLTDSGVAKAEVLTAPKRSA